jgi:esterase
MQLNFKTYGQGRPIIILHGLFGMLDNWQSIAKHIEQKHKIYLIDQRNHGKSPHTSEHSYTAMADDLFEFIEQHHIGSVDILGHSMGGKTAMQFAITYPQFVNSLSVVDMGVKRYEPGHDSIFEALFSIDLKAVKNRNEVEIILDQKIHDVSTKQFILKNLSRQADSTYAWKFNLQSIFANYNSEILAPIISDHPFMKKTLFIRGQNSNYILNTDWDLIQSIFPNSTLVTIKNAGHWVHADNPLELVHVLSKFWDA